MSFQGPQHLGKIVDHRTKITRVIALVHATSQFPADDQDQLLVGVGPIRIGVAELAGSGHSFACQGGENRDRFASREVAPEHVRRGLDDLFHSNPHNPTL